MSPSADYFSDRTVKGRREYTCTFAGCKESIAKGELHVCVSIGSNGKHSTHRGHVKCYELATGRPAPERTTSKPAAAPMLTEVQKRFGAGVTPSMHRKLERFVADES